MFKKKKPQEIPQPVQEAPVEEIPQEEEIQEPQQPQQEEESELTEEIVKDYLTKLANGVTALSARLDEVETRLSNIEYHLRIDF